MIKPQTEKQFLKSYNIHDHDIPLVFVDIAIFGIVDGKSNVLIVKRSQHPGKEKWALQGGFIELSADKTIDDAAHRKLAEKTGVTQAHLEQVASVGDRARDPRGWSVTIAYMALVPVDAVDLKKGDSSEEVAWAPINQLKKNNDLAFDHNKILKSCHRRLIDKVRYTSLPVNLLSLDFTLTELQRIFEVILDKSVEKNPSAAEYSMPKSWKKPGNSDKAVTGPQNYIERMTQKRTTTLAEI